MSNVVSLQSIRDAAEAKYGSLDIPLTDDYTVRLLNPLKLDKTNRDALVDLQEEMDAEKADHEALLSKAIELVAATPEQARRLLEEIGGDVTILMEVFKEYSEGTQVGEASASDD